MIDPIYFTDKVLKAGFIINLDRHHKNHAISKLTINKNQVFEKLKKYMLINFQKKRLLYTLD